MVIQSWAHKIGITFGIRCFRSNREHPVARACSMKSELLSFLIAARITLAGAAQPSAPSNKNVMVTDNIGDTFRGRKALTMSNKNSQGRDKNRSAPLSISLSATPKPAKPPSAAAARQDKTAAAVASKRDTRVP